MNTRQLECFIAVAETLNFTRAAERAFISQTAVTQQIQKLEQQLGVLLFERTNRSVRLTPAGQTFLLEARAILEREKSAIRKTLLAAGGFRGTLNIGWIKGLEMSSFVEYIRRYHEDFPNIALQFSRENMGQLSAMLAQKELDIIFDLCFNLSSEKSVLQKTVLRFPLYAVLAPGHPYAHRLSLTRSELEHSPDHLGAKGQLPEDLETLLFKVAVGMGTAILPSYAVSQIDSWDHLVTIPLEDEAPVEIVAAWNPDNDNPALAHLLKLLP